GRVRDKSRTRSRQRGPLRERPPPRDRWFGARRPGCRLREPNGGFDSLAGLDGRERAPLSLSWPTAGEGVQSPLLKGTHMPSGIHHVTSIASSARRNLDFYIGTLGLRLVKKTVNFDDPGSYHFYYGDAAGHPGTILTFFAWGGPAPGGRGIGETQETPSSIPEGSISYWTQRLVEKGVAHDPPAKRFGATTIAFRDQDGTRLALSGVKGVEAKPGWSGSSVTAEHAIRGFHSVSLLLAEAGPTAAILTDVFGFVGGGSEGPTQRFQA